MRKKLLSCLFCAALLTACSSAETVPEVVSETAAPETVAETKMQIKSETTAGKSIIGLIYANPPEASGYTALLSQPDAESTVLARLYQNDMLAIYSLENDWYFVQYGELEGYVSAAEVSKKPVGTEPAPEVPETQAPAPEPEVPAPEPEAPEPEVPAQEPEPIAEEVPEPEEVYVEYAAPAPTIDGYAEAVDPPEETVYYYFRVTGGDYAYYVVNYQADDITGEVTSSDGYLKVCSGTVFDHVDMQVTPYNADGVPGATVYTTAYTSDLYNFHEEYMEDIPARVPSACPVRTTPSDSTDVNIIGTLPDGATFSVIGSVNGAWYHIRWVESFHYISGEYSYFTSGYVRADQVSLGK